MATPDKSWMDLLGEYTHLPGWANSGLAAGIAGAGAGGLMTAAGPAREGETRGERTKRILRNMAVTGGMAGVAGAALPPALEALMHPVTVDADHQTGTGKVQNKYRWWGGGLGAGAGVGTGYGAGLFRSPIDPTKGTRTGVGTEAEGLLRDYQKRGPAMFTGETAADEQLLKRMGSVSLAGAGETVPVALRSLSRRSWPFATALGLAGLIGGPTALSHLSSGSGLNAPTPSSWHPFHDLNQMLMYSGPDAPATPSPTPNLPNVGGY